MAKRKQQEMDPVTTPVPVANVEPAEAESVHPGPVTTPPIDLSADMADATLTPVDVSTVPTAPVLKSWQVELEGARPAEVVALDEVGAWRAYCSLMGIIDSQATRKVTLIGSVEGEQ